MKNKIKKWHIALMSFLGLFIAVLASLFSLRADTVDEETGETITDNWDIDIVYYDSSVDGGTTPLTEIDWDATLPEQDYKEGIPRVITVQINYKNDSAVTKYNPGAVEISIPNLFYGKTESRYNYSTQKTEYTYFGTHTTTLRAKTTVGANDNTHTNYAWDFVTDDAPSENQETFIFTNANTIEQNSNYEGSIQIVYEVSVIADSPEQFQDYCEEALNKEIEATLKIYENGQVFTSPSWPENYPNNMKQDENYWEYQTNDSGTIYVDFSLDTSVASSDYVFIYKDKTQGYGYQLNNSTNHIQGKKTQFDTNYIKIAMSSNSSGTDKGFRATVYTSVKEIKTNALTFNYTRKISHPWTKKEITVTKHANKFSSYDGLPANAQNYYWVKYDFVGGYCYTEYPYIGISYNTAKFYDEIPSDCIVYDRNWNILSPAEDDLYIFNVGMNGSNGSNSSGIYVAYPKDIYNEENNNLIITNTVEYYGYWADSPSTLSYLNKSSVTINLEDFEFSYSGDLYATKKQSNYFGNEKNAMKYQAIINNWSGNTAYWYHYLTAIYTGSPMTVKSGDDLLYITNKNNEYVRLQDNEYCFTRIQTRGGTNGNGMAILANKYDCELWIRYANTSEYVLYEEFKSPGRNDFKTWDFNEENVVGYYILIKDMKESLKYDGISVINSTTKLKKQDIAESGTLYNFNYLQIYFKDENGNLVLQNEPDINSYANMITKEEIASFDQSTYGTYMQRACDYHKWKYYNVPQVSNGISVLKSNGKIIQDAEKEKFIGSFSLHAALHSGRLETDYKEQYTDDSLIKGFYLYDLLPEGMILESDKEDIVNSLKICRGDDTFWEVSTANFDYYAQVYDKNLNKLSYTDFFTLISNNIEFYTEENWNGTGRTKLTIFVDLQENPIYILNSEQNSSWKFVGISLSYNYSVSYDSYLTFGAVYTNNVYGEYLNASTYKYPARNHSWTYSGNFVTGNSYKIQDNGTRDIAASDINNNNNTTEYLANAMSSITITSVVSTHQDVTTYVQTDYSNYDTGIVDSSVSSNYTYKLRVRTGTANVTNLVIYTSLEEAQPERTRWKGEFLGVDTSYAESKGYVVKVWYSENTTIGTLTEDISWKEYDETTDKSKVKSLAFQYLSSTVATDTDGTTNAAVIPANNLTYVLINMKSPSDESITTLARMDCWTQWNAIDEFDKPIDFITGINSNVVKVALPNSVKSDDMPSVSLNFIKEITGTDAEWNNSTLNKANEQIFVIRLTSLTANDDGTYNQVTGLLSSTRGLTITQIPIGTYLLEELGDNYFDFVEFTNNNDPEIIIEGVTFEKTNQGYIITVSEDLAETVEFNIKVTNQTEAERFYEEKHNKENLFLINKIDSGMMDPDDPQGH